MLFQWSMYYLSFTPLWVSIIFLNIVSLVYETQDWGTEIVSLVVVPVFFVFSLIVMLCGLRPKTIGTTDYDLLEDATENKFVTAEFLATYIIPLIGFDFSTWKGMLLFVFFFLVFGYLCVRHNYFCTNIMLDVFKYRIYNCKLVDKYNVQVEQKVISKRELKLIQGESVRIKKLNNDYSLDCSIGNASND